MSSFVLSSPHAVVSRSGRSALTHLRRGASIRWPRSTYIVVKAGETVVKVCVNKECKRAGSKRVCGMFQAQAEGTNVTIEEVICLDECGMGPNVEIDGKVVNGVKTEEQVKAVLEKTL